MHTIQPKANDWQAERPSDERRVAEDKLNRLRGVPVSYRLPAESPRRIEPEQSLFYSGASCHAPQFL